MTPHGSYEGNRGLGHGNERDVTSTNLMYILLKEKEQEVTAMTQRLNTLKAELEVTKLELRCQKQRYIEKEYECEKIKEIRNKMMEIKDKELQDVKNLAEDLQQRISLLNKYLGADNLPYSSVEGAMSDNEEIHYHQSDTSFSPEERNNRLDMDTEGGDVCPFCLRSTVQTQDLSFHFNNCPDSLKWHGQDTNHSDHYHRVKCK